MIDLLEERRSRMRMEFQQILFDGTKSGEADGSGQCDCGWSSRHSFAYVKLLQAESLQPSQMLNTTLSRLLDKLDRMPDPTVPRNNWAQCGYPWHPNHHYREIRKWKLSKLKEANGLCIDCVRSNSTSEEQSCRVKHE